MSPFVLLPGLASHGSINPVIKIRDSVRLWRTISVQAAIMISSHTSLLLLFLSFCLAENLHTKTIQTQLQSGQFVTIEEFDVAETDE